MSKLIYMAEDHDLRFDEENAGYDIPCNRAIYIMPGMDASISTGIRVAIPKGYVGFVKSRSGLSFKHGMEVGAGVIDEGYRGEIKVKMYNNSRHVFNAEEGDYVAQLVVLKIGEGALRLNYDDFMALCDTQRGEKGFGSSDEKDISNSRTC